MGPTQERSSTALSMTESSTMTHNVSSRATSAIELRDVTKRFLTPTGQAYTAIRDVTLSVAPGEFCAVVGPTGCGKSTTLGLVSGLERPSEGSVQVMGEPVQGIDPRIGYVFQADARSEEHTSELQSLAYLVCRLLLEKKKKWSRQSVCS